MKVMTMTKTTKRETTTKTPKRPASTRLRLHSIQPTNPVEPLDEAPVAPEPAAPVLVNEPVSVAPEVAVKPPRSEAETLGASAARYLRKPARIHYTDEQCDGIVKLARAAWRAALVELAVEEGQ